MARFNRAVTNHLTLPLAGRLFFAIVCHVGRRSGREYRTPVNLYAMPGRRFRVALTYGRNAEWVRNLLAAGRVRIITRGRHHELVDPAVVRDPARSAVRVPMRLMLEALGVADFLELRLMADGLRAE